MKRLLLIVVLSLFIGHMNAQKGTTQFAIFGGYEQFSEIWADKGYNVGLEFKHYLSNRWYGVVNFHAGVNDGHHDTSYTSNKVSYSFTLFNSVRDYMIGIGMGFDALSINRHKIYVQATAGLGTTDRKYDYVSSNKPETHQLEITRYAISASAGYDYQVSKHLAVGVNYTGWQIGYNYNNSYNAKINVIF